MNNSQGQRLIVFLLAFINFTHIIDSMLVMPLGDIFIEEFSLNANEYSLLVSGYAAAATISGLLGIFWMDRFNRKKSLLIIYLGFSIGTLICGFSTNYEQLLFWRIITGCFGGIIGALLLSIISDLFRFKERGQAIGYLFTAFSVASALGVPMGIYIAGLGTWNIPFIALGILGLLTATVTYILLPDLKQPNSPTIIKKNPLQILNSIISDKNQRIALWAGFILILAHFMIIPFISPYMMRNVGLTQNQIAIQFFLGGIFTLFTSPYIGKLTDSKGVNKVFITLLLISFIPTLLITHLGKVHVVLALSCTTMFFIFASGRMISPNTIISAAAPQENRGSFMSLKSSLQQFAVALASLISGQIVFINESKIYENYQYLGYISVVLGILSIYWVLRIKVAKGN